MHGTRSIQKLIENTTIPSHIQILVKSLNLQVCKLIKDLNGNHVIQKCLAKLSRNQNQFIYDAVSRQCISVATHRHGCCVLQRCLDYAVETQRVQLVKVVSHNALVLVQVKN
jgi:Pumilio-family RNA binding repeat